MRNFILAAALLACATGARASALPDFETPMAALVAAARVRPAPKAVLPPPRERAADAATWARLLERARLRPTTTQEVHAGQTDYQVFIVVLPKAVAGQACAADMTPRVSFFVSQVLRGPGGEVYPARLTVQCVGAAVTREELAVDADEDGPIGDAVLYEPSSGKLVQTTKVKLTTAQRARFDALLSGAVAVLLEN